MFQFLKFVAMALAVPVIAAVLLVAVILAFVGGYVAWLAGVPIKVRINGRPAARYRWLTRVS